MNLLAHALIAYHSLPDFSGQAVTGALMADYFKGQDLADYPEGIRVGILQHKAVDAFTDSHPEFVKVRSLIANSGAERLCSGILADIFFDHILASRWDKYGRPYCLHSLYAFSRTIYEKLESSKNYHSPRFAIASQFITSQSWFEKYASIDGIKDTLKGVQSRMSGNVDLVSSVKLLDSLGAEMEKVFSIFWPALLAFSRNWASQLDGQ